MGLIDVQERFVRLNTDAVFRRESVITGDRETASFACLEREIERHARSLVSKRLMAVRGMLAGTRRALGDDHFEKEFREYAMKSDTPHGIHRHRLDALCFARVLGAKARQGHIAPAVVDLSAHECAPIGMWTEKRRWLVRFHLRSPAELLQMVHEDADLLTAPFRPSLVLWRSPRKGHHGYRWQQFAV